MCRFLFSSLNITNRGVEVRTMMNVERFSDNWKIRPDLKYFNPLGFLYLILYIYNVSFQFFVY